MSKLIKSEVRSRLGVDLRSRPIPTVTTMPAGGSPPGHTGDRSLGHSGLQSAGTTNHLRLTAVG
jgi:hypothetical protein